MRDNKNLQLMTKIDWFNAQRTCENSACRFKQIRYVNYVIS